MLGGGIERPVTNCNEMRSYSWLFIVGLGRKDGGDGIKELIVAFDFESMANGDSVQSPTMI